MRLKVSSVLSSCATLAAAALLASPMPPAFAQASGSASNNASLLATPAIRVTAPIQNDALVMLKGNTSPMAQARYDQGAASTSLATGKMQLLLKRSPAQEIALREYMGSLQDPHAATYHKWLTPQTYGASFGVADQDLQAVESWLQGQGFKIESVPASRNLIQFSGTTGQVAQAFHTSIHAYLINGEKHYSNASDPQIPAALAPVITGISPLNDFHPKPMHVLGGHAQVQSKAGALQVVPEAALRTQNNVAPLLTLPQNNLPTLFLTPSDAATIYDAPNFLNRNYGGATQQIGAGINIGLVGPSDLQVADYLNYRRLFLNESNPVSPSLVVDGTNPGVEAGGYAVEALLDAELAAGLAPGANIFFYSSANALVEDGVYNAALRAVEDNNVAILSVSYGNCEAAYGPAGNAQNSELWRQAAAQGITVLVSSGDNGSAACDFGNQATQGLAVSGFASTLYNIAVGGTDFNVLANNFSQYVNSPTGGGTSPYLGSVLSYIPENPWNDSISNSPVGNYTSDTAAKYTDTTSTTPFTVLAAGSGGASTLGFCGNIDYANNTCVGPQLGYPTPPFQSGISFSDPTIPTGVRYIPDISLFAAPGYRHQAEWALCSDSATDGSSQAGVDCQPNATTGQFSVAGIGGTSAASPAFAGMLGMVLSSLGNGQRLGLANNTLYNLQATSANSASIFHDITAGNISVPCKAGTPNCGSNGFLNGYNAGSGFDLATGLGSVDIAQLVGNWDKVQFAQTGVSLQVNNSTAPLNVQHGSTVTLSTQVAPGSVTGTVGVTATTGGQAGAALNRNIPLNGGAGSVIVSDLPGGSYSIHAYYQGDVKDSPSTSSPIAVLITPEPSLPFLSIAVGSLASRNYTNNPATAPYGALAFAYVTPANSNVSNTIGSHGVATGSASLLNNNISLGTNPINSEGTAAFSLSGYAPGTYSFTAQYGGDNSYNASTTTTALPLLITKANTTLVIHTGSTSNTTVTVELDTDSGGASPTGNITLTVNGKPISAAGTNGSLPDGAVAQFATFSIPSTMLQSSGNTLQASYVGDSNYNTSNVSSCSYTPANSVATASEMPHPNPNSTVKRLLAGSSVALSFALFFCIPARRHAWRSMVVLFFAASLLGTVGCGSTSTSTSNNNPVSTLPACTK